MSICDDQFSPNCDVCLEVSRADNDLTFLYSLAPLTQYYLFIIDLFKNSYRALFTSDLSGGFTIDPTNAAYPTGLFNQYGGELEIFISTDSEGLNIEPLTYYATEYNCLLLTITASTGINCEPFVPVGCDPAYVTDSDGVTIFEVASGEAGTCTPSVTGNFNMIINVENTEIYSEIWNSEDTNTINIL